LGKPADGTVAGRVGLAGRFPAKPGSSTGSNWRDVDSLLLERCRDDKTPREVLAAERLRAETLGKAVK